MDSIKYEESDRTPLIEGSISTGVIKISGRSYPEDAAEFFQPFCDWLTCFYAQTPGEVRLELDLDYVNTATTALLHDLINQLSKLSELRIVQVIWRYEEDDFDMTEKGNDFKHLLGELITLVERNDRYTTV